MIGAIDIPRLVVPVSPRLHGVPQDWLPPLLRYWATLRCASVEVNEQLMDWCRRHEAQMRDGRG